MTTADRPLATFALFAYNQEKYIREAIEGAFAQTYEPLEIILSDDCSSDRTFEIMQEMAAKYEGPHKIILNKNAINLGLAAHFSTVMKASKGKYIVVAAGDDISLPDRAENCIEIFNSKEDISVVDVHVTDFSGSANFSFVEPVGVLTVVEFGVEDVFQDNLPKLIGAGRAFRASSFDRYPPLEADCPTEDTTGIIRALMVGQGRLIERVGVLRRIHSTNASRNNFGKIESIERIFNQYTKDINYAYEREFINSTTRRALWKWSARKALRRKVNIIIESSRSQKYSTSRYEDAKSIVFSNSLRLSEKIRVLTSKYLIKKFFGIETKRRNRR